MQLISKLKKEFSFIQGNYLILVLSWILMDFAMELPGTYYPRYGEELAGSPFIVGVIGFAAFLALASVQFPGGYLADKYGRKWLISTMTFGVALSYVFYAVAPVWHFIFAGAIIGNLCLLYQPARARICLTPSSEHVRCPRKLRASRAHVPLESEKVFANSLSDVQADNGHE